jgi:hypothetical protein
MRFTLIAAIVVLSGTPAMAHRLDEYLQGTILSIEKDRVQAQVTLTPGIAVFPALLARIDTDGDGTVSESESRAYGRRVLRDMSLSIDGRALTPRLVSARFPAIGEMKEGRGEIRIEFDSDLPSGGPGRKLILENRHERLIAAYQVNCLVPRDPNIRIVAQNRNYTQSFYELDYEQAPALSPPLLFYWPGGLRGAVTAVALMLIVRLGFLSRRPARSEK